jgi:hypothetical protein
VWTLLLLLALAPTPSPDEVREERDRVFSRPEFDPEAHRDSWLAQALRDFFGWLGRLRHGAPLLFALLLLACLAGLGGLFAWLLKGLGGTFSLGARSPPGAARAEQRRRLSRLHREMAEASARKGDYTEAVRFLFLSLAFLYDESGRVGFPRASTNREYLDLLAGRLPDPGPLRLFVDTLDEDWYGQRPTARQRYEECLALYDRLADG